MLSIELLLGIVAAFLIAGIVKGVIGFGLPSVVLALLAATVGLNEAMVLLLVPCFVTNLWQALGGGKLVYVLKRFWTLLLGIGLVSWVGASWHVSTDPRWLISLLGGLLCAYALMSLVIRQIPAPGRHEIVLSPIMGAISGLLNGLTGSFVVPGVLYLQALGLPRDTLIQALGVLFITSTVALGISLRGNGLLSGEFLVLSVLGVIPALLGMRFGLVLRQKLDAVQFRRAFFAALMGFGIYLLINPVVHQ